MPSRSNQKGPEAGGIDARPADYAIGSPQSRAAAREILERRISGKERFDFILDLGMSIEDLKIGEWIETEEGTLSRISIVPEGMTIEEAERIVVGERE